MKTFRKPSTFLSGLLTIALFGTIAAHPGISAADSKKAPAADATPDTAKTVPSLEQMVKDLDLPYKATDGGKFIVSFSVSDAATTKMILGETSLAGNDKFKLITIATLIQDGTKDKKLSPAVIAYITDFNYQSDIGRIGIDSDNDVWYQSSLWKATATEETLTYDLFFAHINTQKVIKKLKAMASEG